jgi:hypothetical protein
VVITRLFDEHLENDWVGGKGGGKGAVWCCLVVPGPLKSLAWMCQLLNLEMMIPEMIPASPVLVPKLMVQGRECPCYLSVICALSTRNNLCCLCPLGVVLGMVNLTVILCYTWLPHIATMYYTCTVDVVDWC